MFMTQMIWKYNLMYVLDSEMDSKGLFYPQALIHLTIGLYLAEICLIGLFALKSAFAPLALMVLFFIFTGLVHFSLSDAIAPLLLNLPQTLSLEGEVQEEELARAAREKQRSMARLEVASEPPGAANDYYDTEQDFGDPTDNHLSGDEEQDEDEDEDEVDDNHGPISGTRTVEGASGVGSAIKEWFKTSTRAKIAQASDQSGVSELVSKLQFWTHGKHDSEKSPGFLARWLHPEEYEDFVALRNTIPDDQFPRVDYPAAYARRCYLPPEMWEPKPTLWIPQDHARVSRQEVAHTRKLTPISDQGVELDEKGRVVIQYDKAPIRKPRLLL